MAGRGPDHDYRNWRKSVYDSPPSPPGLSTGRPYDLRHSFVSLLINESVSIVEVARQAGHSPEECLRTYAHTFDEFDPADRPPAETVINAAERKGPSTHAACTRSSTCHARGARIWLYDCKPTVGFEPTTPALRGMEPVAASARNPMPTIASGLGVAGRGRGDRPISGPRGPRRRGA